MQTMPIMDAFGNACMPRNDDSSRFGKLYKIFFDKRKKTVTGASVTPYLLEKSRVCIQSSWERNFHIFYYMCFYAEIDVNFKEKYGLLPPQEYCFLNRFIDDESMPTAASGDAGIGDDKAGVCQFEICDRSQSGGGRFVVSKPGSDADEFLVTREALRVNGFTDEAVDELWRIVSGILSLGNIKFEYNNPTDTPKLKDDDPILVKTAGLLGVPSDSLKLCLLHGSRQTAGKTIFTNYQAHKVLKLRDSLARTIYNDVFEELIDQFSGRLLPPTHKKDTFLGVLDIFGFEFVEQKDLKPGKLVNSFEQFCINLCNEKLQNHFVSCVFDVEIAQYQSENLKVTTDDFEFVGNELTLDLLQGPRGILDELNNVGNNPSLKDGKDDVKFLQMITYLKGKTWQIKGKKIETAISIPKTRGRSGYEGSERIKYAGGFQIRHYAAEVIYDVDYWVEKNRDQLETEQYKTIAQSAYLNESGKPGNHHVSLLNKFFTERNPASKERGRKPATLGSNFKNNLYQLVDNTLKSCRCSFVRCIKPNTLKQPAHYDSSLVLNQLQYTGMLDTLIIRKEGWPKRPTHREFYNRFKPLFPSEKDHVGIINRLVADTQYSGLVAAGAGLKTAMPKHVKEIIVFIGKNRVL